MSANVWPICFSFPTHNPKTQGEFLLGGMLRGAGDSLNLKNLGFLVSKFLRSTVSWLIGFNISWSKSFLFSNFKIQSFNDPMIPNGSVRIMFGPSSAIARVGKHLKMEHVYSTNYQKTMFEKFES